MGRRRNWKWFSGIAAVIGCISSCTTEEAANDNASNACTLSASDGGSVLHCGLGTNIPLDGSGSFLANSAREEEGNNCENGGTRLEIGRDHDDDGVLDPKEVDSVQYVCSSASGNDTGHVLIAVTEEDAGDNCSAGGQLIQSGLDDNGNDVLDPEEVDAQHYVCNGSDGAGGPTGSTGANGDAGADGPASLVNVTPIQGGNNSPCPEGGQQVEFGLDDDRDGVLDAEEVDGSEYVCSGAQGSQGSQGSQGPIGDAGADGVNTLLLVSIEDPGDNCAWGGQRFEWGLDDDRDGVLDVPQWQPVTLADGGDAGGDAGMVAVGNNEVDGVSYVCSGSPTTLTSVTPEPRDISYYNETCNWHSTWWWQGCWEAGPGDAGSTYNPTCTTVWDYWWSGCWDSYYGGCYPSAGQRIDTGADDNNNGVLDSEEIDNTEFVCDGLQSLVNIQPVDTQVLECASWYYWGCWNWQWVPGGPCDGNTGQQIQSGLDQNGNGVLEPNEVTDTEYVCDGLQSLVDVTPEPAQSQVWAWYYGCWGWNDCYDTVYGACYPNDGQQIDTGLDQNGNGVLEPGEIDETAYVCDGDGQVPG